MSLTNTRTHNFSWPELFAALKKLRWAASELEIGHPIFEQVVELETFIISEKEKEEQKMPRSCCQIMEFLQASGHTPYLDDDGVICGCDAKFPYPILHCPWCSLAIKWMT